MEQCRECGEHLVGDGYTTPIHCPNVDVENLTPDDDVVLCGNKDTVESEQ